MCTHVLFLLKRYEFTNLGMPAVNKGELNVNYNLREFGASLMLPSFYLEYMHTSWSYLTTNLWNGLSTRVRECPNLAAFRRALFSFMARL